MPTLKYTSEIMAKSKSEGIKIDDLMRDTYDKHLTDNYGDSKRKLIELAMHEAGFDNNSNMYDIYNYSQSNDNNNALYPVFVDTTLQMIRENNTQDIIYPSILAGEQTIPSDGWKGIYLDLGDEKNKKAMKLQGIEEYGEFPKAKLKSGEQSLKMHKFGISVTQSYETMRRLRVPLVADHLSLLARRFGNQNLTALIKTLIDGDGNGNAIPSNMKFNVAAAGTLTTLDLVNASVEFSDVSDLTANTYLCTKGAYKKLLSLYMSINNFSGFAPGVTFTFPQNILNGASVYYIKDLALATGDKDRIIMANKENGVKKFYEAGSIISENKQNMDNQSYDYFLSEVCAFQKLNKYSAAELLI